MTKLVTINKSTNTAIVEHGGVFVHIDTDKKDVISTSDSFTMAASEGWETQVGEAPDLWVELAVAETTNLSVESSEHAEDSRIFRVPRNIQKESKTFTEQTTTLHDIHEFVVSRTKETDIVKQWVKKITDQFPVPSALVAAGFEPSDTSVYFGRAVGEDTTECDAMYALNSEEQWAERVDGQWKPVTEEDPGLLYNLIMLDPESALALANWADEPDDLDGGSLELAALNPDEAGLFYAAEAELDFEFMDRLFDVYDSTERSINAAKQVRGKGGKFGPNPGGSEGTAAAPKARLSSTLPLVPDIGARIDQYLVEVEAKRSNSPEKDNVDSQPESDGDFGVEDFNWISEVGGLPKYIKRISKHLQEKGMTEGHAIATAVNVVEKACATGDLNFPGVQHENAGSRAEACAAVAEWEAKKAKAKSDNSIGSMLSLLDPDTEPRVRLEAAKQILDRVDSKDLEMAITAQQSGVPTTDVKPLYIAIVDDLDTDAVLDVVSLVPPAKGITGDVTAWKRAAGQWVAANELLAALRGSTPPSCVELTDPALLKEVLAQVDKSTADEADPVKVPGQTDVDPITGKPAEAPKAPETPDIPVKTSNFATLPNGSYPINNKEDLKRAVQAYGRAKNKTAAKKHIISQAKKLKATELLPDNWEFSTEVDLSAMSARGYAFSDGSLLIRNATELRDAVKEANGYEQQLHVIKRARALNRIDMVPRHWSPLEASVEQHTLWGPYGELLPMTAAGGVDRNRGGAERLRHYWTKGLGGTKIGWGAPNDGTRCIAYLSKYLGGKSRAAGYCNLRHFEMNGYYMGDSRNK